jgi:Type IV secretory pathway, VirB9 components
MKKIISKIIVGLLFQTGLYATEEMSQNPDVEEQVQGNYPMLERGDLQPLGAIQRAWDHTARSSGVYRTIYHPGEIIKLRTREYTTTTVVFPAWERIDEVVLGDEGAYEIQKIKPNILVIRAKDFVGLDSTITLMGASGRVYGFYIRTEGYNSKHISDVTVYIKIPGIKANFYESQPLATREKDYLEDVIVNLESLNFAFNMAGDSSIAPERVYTDGIRTWFDFGTSLKEKNLPTIYKVEDGVDTPINVSREGNKLVAQAVGSFALKNGEKFVCVWLDKGSKG